MEKFHFQIEIAGEISFSCGTERCFPFSSCCHRQWPLPHMSRAFQCSKWCTTEPATPRVKQPPTGPCGFSPFAVVVSLSQMLAKAHGSCSAYLSSWQFRSASDYHSQSPPDDDECLARKLLVLPILSVDSDTVVQDAYLHLTNSFSTCSNAF